MRSHRTGHGRASPIALAVCAALASGCTAGPPPAGAQFDGTYVGDNLLVSAGAGFPCGNQAYPQSIAVTAGRFDYPFAVNPPLSTVVPVQLAADGSFEAKRQYGVQELTPRNLFRTEWVTVTGRIAGNALQATVTDYRCTRRLELARR